MVDSIKLADANRAFADAIRRNNGITPSTNKYMNAGGQSVQAGATFGDMLETSLRGALQSQKVAEQKSMEAIFKKTALPDLVSALDKADIALKTVTALRSKIIQTYQEIIKMPV